ncbi:MAG: beta-propeller domain-containing protein [Desulfamplus sp.]|nr:beta-propeller domain-containing protein [Desulfamplus sp.]
MKNIYCEDTDNLYRSYDKQSGIKSLIYFILMAALIFSMFFLPEKIYAEDIKFGVQITNKAKLLGTISGRFLKDFDKSDLYVIAYPKAEKLDQEKIFSLAMIDNDPRKMVWKNQISMFSTYDCIKAGGWGFLTSIDFSSFKDQNSKEMPELVFSLILVKSGGDILNSSDWIDSAVTSLITNPSQRIPGQTQFVTDQSNDRYYPADAETIVTPNSQEDDKSDDNGSDVEKPDIYKISDSKLFYANGSAGKFQVVDISKPDSPTLIHSESLENTPLDIYINNEYAILLEQMSEQDNTSVVLKVFQVKGNVINKISEQAYTDIQYIASRKSGDRIFITGTVPYYYPYTVDTSDKGGNENSIDDSSPDEGGSLVAAVDISNPLLPVLISKKKLEGYDSDIYLNSDYLVQIARVSWDNTELNLFDLNQNDPLTRVAQIKIPGRVPSEYHVNISDNALFVIYRDQDISKGSSLKIFDIGSSDVKEKGSVGGIAPGEDLFAGTFMDNRAYIVTYERKDPLWVIDITDHTAPKIMGELEVPGWSEYIRFHKNRLIALGYDDSDGKRRVSVALFSVEDPLKPTLLDRVTPMAGIADYTYSIAIEDDRGFYLNTASGVIMVPISYYTVGNYSGLEVIHVDEDWNSFKRDDFVQADFNVQRGAEADSSDSSDNLADIALSMGDSALNTINISSTQKPVILGELRLAYNIEKIALYQGDTSQGQKSIFALGGDFYTDGTSDLMRYDSTSGSQSIDGQFNFTKPSTIKDSELLYPELLIDNNSNSVGIMFSWSSAAFKLFDPKTMTMGNIVKLGDTSTWTTSDPILSENRLYFAISQYYYPKDDVTENGDDYYIESSYSINTTLKRYTCSDINNPVQLPDISIPGTPKGIFSNGTQLITIETTRYYYPYYAYESKSSALRSDIKSDDKPILPDPPEIPESTQGTRINAIQIGEDSGVLDKTLFFDQDTYGYSEVVCDKENIYLVAVKDDETKIHVIDPLTLNIISSYDIKGSYSPVKALNGKILFTARNYYPYWRTFMPPYWNNNEIKIIDVSGGALQEIATFSNDIYAAQNNTVMEDSGIYIANGYKGVDYFPFVK